LFKFFIKKNHQTEILRIDNNYVKFNFTNISNSVLNRKNINLYYFIISFFQYIFRKPNLSFKEIYWKNIILSFRPKVVIGHNIDHLIFKIKNFLPQLITMVYQHNYIYDSNIAEYKMKFKDFKCDYFFVFDERHRDIFSEFIDSKFIIVGSVKNNEINYINNTKKEYALMYVSEFRNYPKRDFRSKAEIFIFNILTDYCKQKNIKLCIALTSNRHEKRTQINIDDELNFYNHKKNKFFIEKINSYELAHKSELCVCLSSNLGLELLARGIKVLYLPILELYDSKFKFPYFRNNNSFISYVGLDQEKIFKKLDYLLYLHKNDWKKMIGNESCKFTYDQDNTILKNKIKSYVRLR